MLSLFWLPLSISTYIFVIHQLIQCLIGFASYFSRYHHFPVFIDFWITNCVVSKMHHPEYFCSLCQKCFVWKNHDQRFTNLFVKHKTYSAGGSHQHHDHIRSCKWTCTIRFVQQLEIICQFVLLTYFDLPGVFCSLGVRKWPTAFFFIQFSSKICWGISKKIRVNPAIQYRRSNWLMLIVLMRRWVSEIQ